MDGISFVTTDEDRWGAGLEVPLPASEIDMNFWTLLKRVQQLEGGVTAIGIGNIEFDPEAGTITIYLTDGTPFGPFPLPVAELRFFSEWENNVTYRAGDLISIDGLGIFKVNILHTTPASPAPFNPNAVDGEGKRLYHQVMGNIIPLQFDLAMSLNGPIPGDGEPIMTYVVVRNMRLLEELPLSRFYLADAPTGDLAIKITKNGDQIGQLHFFEGDNVGSATFINTVTFEPGDVIQLLAPFDVDETAGDLSVNFVAERL